MYTAETPLLSKHAKLEYKNYIRNYLEDLFNDRFFLYEVEVEGKQTVVVSVVELKDKMDIETGKEVISK
jgi:hypothetical protein